MFTYISFSLSLPFSLSLSIYIYMHVLISFIPLPLLFVAVALGGVEEEFQDVEEMVEKLGLKGTAEAFVKAGVPQPSWVSDISLIKYPT